MYKVRVHGRIPVHASIFLVRMIKTVNFDDDDRDGDAGLRHGPYSCPSQLLVPE